MLRRRLFGLLSRDHEEALSQAARARLLPVDHTIVQCGSLQMSCKVGVNHACHCMSHRTGAGRAPFVMSNEWSEDWCSALVAHRAAAGRA